MGEPDTEPWVGEGKLAYHVDHMPQFRVPALEKFEASGRIEEQLPDLDIGADWPRPFPHLTDHPTVQLQPGSGLPKLRTGR